MSTTIGEELRARYGEPDRLDTADVLRSVGLESNDGAVAFGYPNAEAADAFAYANETQWGHRVLRIRSSETPVNVIFLRFSEVGD